MGWCDLPRRAILAGSFLLLEVPVNLSCRLLGVLLLSATSFAQSPPATASANTTAQPVRRVKVEPDDAAALVVQRAAVKYPDAARNAGVQGTVVLNVVTASSGDVKDVIVVSGDTALAQAATDAVKQWKYKPYLMDGSPVEMETRVTLNFHIRPKTTPEPLSLGRFEDNAYFNEYLGLFYPLSPDWVRETEIARKNLTSEGSQEGTHVLLAAVYVPHNAELSQVNSFFTLIALDEPGTNCKQYLDAMANSLQAGKKAQQKGDVNQFAVAGHDLYRSNFEFREGVNYRSLICSPAKDRLLIWNIGGSSKNAVETAVATLNAITASPPAAIPGTPAAPESSATQSPLPTQPVKVKVASGVTSGLLVKKVAPVYPPEARRAHIQGSVVMRAQINKAGDIVDLEVIDGPIELAVSAVNAVRQWKYRPYLLMGEPVTVETQIVVNYQLSH